MNKLKLPPRGMSTTASLIIALLSNACTSVGPSELVATHQGYHDAVQLAQSREMRSNIVRLRFGDPMQFLSVQSINAQFSVSANVSATGAGDSDQLSAGVGFSDSPTITFAPRGNRAFQQALLGSIGLDQVVMGTSTHKSIRRTEVVQCCRCHSVAIDWGSSGRKFKSCRPDQFSYIDNSLR